MKTKFPLLLIVASFLTMGAAAPVRMTSVKIADNGYVLQHPRGSGNSMVVVTGDGVMMRDEVAKMIAAGKSVEQIEKEFKVPQEFAHYTRPERLRSFLKLFYNQLTETGY